MSSVPEFELVCMDSALGAARALLHAASGALLHVKQARPEDAGPLASSMQLVERIAAACQAFASTMVAAAEPAAAWAEVVAADSQRLMSACGKEEYQFLHSLVLANARHSTRQLISVQNAVSLAVTSGAMSSSLGPGQREKEHHNRQVVKVLAEEHVLASAAMQAKQAMERMHNLAAAWQRDASACMGQEGGLHGRSAILGDSMLTGLRAAVEAASRVHADADRARRSVASMVALLGPKWERRMRAAGLPFRIG